MNLYIKDLLYANILALIITAILVALGWGPINGISVSLLLLCAIFFIWGGGLGFFLSSVSLDVILRFFRRGRGKGKEEEEVVKDPKQKQLERREQIALGKRMIILGSILFLESILIAFTYYLFF